VLVGILLVALLILSGCGTNYKDGCKESAAYKCYENMVVPRVGAENECGKEGYTTIGNLCFAVGNAAACSQLNEKVGDANAVKLKWAPVNVPKYNVNLCYPTCQSNGDCNSGDECLTQGTIKFCSPACFDDSDCLPGLNHCGVIYNTKHCLLNDDLWTPSSVTADVELNIPEHPQVGDTFLANIYITPNVDTLGLVYIALLKSGTGAEFTGKVQNGIFAYAAKGKSKPYDYFAETAGYLLQFPTPIKVVPHQRYILGMAELKVTGTGNFTVILVDKMSYAGADSADPPKTKYPIIKGSVIVAKYLEDSDKVCVPKSSAAACTATSCGSMDDGCGGKVECTTCTSGQVCVNNACVLAVSIPADAPQKDKTVLQGVSAALKDSNSNSIQKLSALIQAIKAWFAAP